MEPSAGRDTQIMPEADGLLWAGEHRDTHPRGGVRAGEHLGWLQSAAPRTPCDATHSTPSHRTLPEVPGMAGAHSRSGTPSFALLLPPAGVQLPMFCCLPVAAGSLLLPCAAWGMSSPSPWALLRAAAAWAGTQADIPGWGESGSLQHW